MVDEIAPRSEVLERSLALAHRLCEMAPYAVEAAKYLVDASIEHDIEAGLLLERTIAMNMGSPEERAAAVEHAKESDAKYRQIFSRP
jgi:enoyl-CoA hydratase/carnithine racemase